MKTLYDRLLGCIAGSSIGSAMGAAVEGWEPQRIGKEHGILEELLPYRHYTHIDRPGAGRERPPGTTEDGIERQRLMCTAIIEKGGRITASDLAGVWRRDIDPGYFGVQMEPCDEVLYGAVMSGIPVQYVGRFSDYPGIVSFARSCHPIGLINACHPRQAARDSYEVGQLYQPAHGYGLDYAAAYSAALAESFRPGAGVDAVLEVALHHLPEGDRIQKPRHELEWALDLAEKSGDVWEMRDLFYERYDGRGLPYNLSYAQEVVTKGLAIFYKTGGNLYESIVTAVNFGRDTDCTAAVAAGLAGAYEGTASIPGEWIETVDEATRMNEYTVSRRLLGETAAGLEEALLNEMESLGRVVDEVRVLADAGDE